jgi:DNA-directed RNA polymerase subunit E'/Rpb7
MYSATTTFVDIKPVQPALTSFAVQTVQDQMAKEVENAVKPSSGLCVFVKNQSDMKRTEWADISAATIS